MKLYTGQEILKKYDGVFVKLYPHHYKGDAEGNFCTLYEVLGTSKKIKENYNTPEDELAFYN